MGLLLLVMALRVEYLENPVGIDETQPRLSWVIQANQRGQVQHAYHVVVASSRDLLARDIGDLWDSGKVISDQSTHVIYRGHPLASRQTCWWKVRIRNQDDHPSPWSEPAVWTMGLLEPSDWLGSWIGYDEPRPEEASKPDPILLDGNAWVSLPEDPPAEPGPGNVRYFRKTIEVAFDHKVALAQFLISSGDQFTLYVNGAKAGTSDGRYGAHRRPSLIDVTPFLAPGENIFAIAATHTRQKPGIIGKLRIDYENSPSREEDINTSWKVTDAQQQDNGWTSLEFNDAAWRDAREVGRAGDEPWGPFHLPDGTLDIRPCPYLRRRFTLNKPIEQGTVYATALGLYELHINGNKVGQDVFTPGWTDYNKRVYYQTYDVTDLLQQGENVVGVVLGHGWYSGHLGWKIADRGRYGRNPRTLVQLDVRYADGTSAAVTTDGTWKAAHGPIVGADFYMGEVFDARKELPGWDRPGYDDSAWRRVAVEEKVDAKIEAYPGVPVRKIMEITPKSVTEPEPGVFIYDLGQNIVGWARLKVRGERGKKITLRFAEMLNPDGTIYIENLRSARAVDEYWLEGGKEEIWEPRFTFHGFRYVEMTGFPEKPPLDAIMGVVVHSDMRPSGAFETSHSLLNQLQHNIQWGQRGNFLEVPTDCPQRDERLGWMGDAQVFCRTACFNMDTAAFFTKWMQDVEDGQLPNGAFADVSPRVVVTTPGSPGWADAGVIIPWIIYQCYGDTRIIEAHYDVMKAWIEYMGMDNPDFIRRNNLNNNYGDWLFKGKPTPKDLIATAYYAYSSRLLSRMAAAIGKEGDAENYERLFQQIKSAFIDAYVKEDGRVEGESQTAYVLALHFDLLPDDLRRRAAQRLVENIEDREWHISTGFLGCPYITETLADAGYIDVAYRLLLRETYPSWLYSVTQGATTVWERWDGWRHDGGFQDPGMNSFNHYAYGAVGAWMYKAIAGIDLDPKQPGYKHIVIRPQPGGGLSHAKAEYDSMYGKIISAWRINDKKFELEVAVPVNTTATVYVPANKARQVREGNVRAKRAQGVRVIGIENGSAIFEVGSGHYQFTSPAPQEVEARKN